MARRAPLKATGEPRAPTFNTSELLQTGRASPGWALKRSGRRLTGIFGRPGGKLLSEHIEVESGKNNDRQQLQPCHLARLARNQVRFGLRQAAQCGGAAANASGERRPGQAAASEPSQAPPGLASIGPKASRLPPPPRVLPSPEALRAHRAPEMSSRWPKNSVVVVVDWIDQAGAENDARRRDSNAAPRAHQRP